MDEACQYLGSISRPTLYKLVREGIDSRPTPLPARAVLRLLRRCSTWEGTASPELLSLIGGREAGNPERSDPLIRSSS